MALINCPECGNEISDTVKNCPKCGYKIKTSRSGKKVIGIIIGLLVLICIAGGVYWYLKEETCTFGHIWKEATCEEPQICEKCGEKEGTALGHKWKNATCTEPETCEVCGKKKGDPLGHSTRMGYCSICGQYINELQDVYDSINNDITKVFDLLSESMDTMHVTDSYYDTRYVAQANQIDYQAKQLLNDVADRAYEYEEFFDVAYKISSAAACIYYFEDLTESTGFGAYEYETAMATSLGSCAQTLGDVTLLLKKMKE